MAYTKKGPAPHYTLKEPEANAEGETVAWHQIGVAWVKQDGTISVAFHAHPVGRQIMLFPTE